MMRLEAEVKQITRAIRMAAHNAETALARALIREALAATGDIIPAVGNCSSASTRSPHHGAPQGLAALCHQLTQALARYPGTSLVLRYEAKPHPGIA
jgi:hypothetical protein